MDNIYNRENCIRVNIYGEISKIKRENSTNNFIFSVIKIVNNINLVRTVLFEERRLMKYFI